MITMTRLQWLIGKRVDLELQGKLLSLTQAKELSMLTDGLDNNTLFNNYEAALQSKLRDNDTFNK